MKGLKNTLVCAFILSLIAVAVFFIPTVAVNAAEETDTESPVVEVPVDEFRVAIGAYPAEDVFNVVDDSDNCTVSIVWSDGALDELGRLKEGKHTCTITVTYKDGNSSSEVIKYVVEEVRRITFVADDEVVGVVEYFPDEIDDLVYPDVPQKRNHTAGWEDFTPSLLEDQTVYAVYVYTGSKAGSGCKSNAGSGLTGIAVVMAVAIIKRIRKG